MPQPFSDLQYPALRQGIFFAEISQANQFLKNRFQKAAAFGGGDSPRGGQCHQL